MGSEQPPYFDTDMQTDELYNKQRDLAINQNREAEEKRRSNLFASLNALRKQKKGLKGEAKKKIEEEIAEIERQLQL